MVIALAIVRMLKRSHPYRAPGHSKYPCRSNNLIPLDHGLLVLKASATLAFKSGQAAAVVHLAHQMHVSSKAGFLACSKA